MARGVTPGVVIAFLLVLGFASSADAQCSGQRTCTRSAPEILAAAAPLLRTRLPDPADQLTPGGPRSGGPLTVDVYMKN